METHRGLTDNNATKIAPLISDLHKDQVTRCWPPQLHAPQPETIATLLSKDQMDKPKPENAMREHKHKGGEEVGDKNK